MMRKICSYCRDEMGGDPTLPDDRVTHGMCDDCYEYFNRQWNGLSLGEYLDYFDHPVMIVDDDVRLLAANRLMADLIHMGDREYFGLLGGEAMECVYARLPEGCGRTVHCKTCALRISVRHTFSTEKTLENVPATMNLTDSTIGFRIDTRMIDDGEGTRAVQVVITDVEGGG